MATETSETLEPLRDPRPVDLQDYGYRCIPRQLFLFSLDT